VRPRIRYCSTAAGRVAYSTAGAGPALLFDSGLITRLRGQLELYSFGDFVERLAERFTVIRYDKPGCGLSDRDGIDLSLRQLAQEYERPAGLGRLELTITPAGSLDKAVVDEYADLGVDRLVLLPQPDAAPSQRHAPVAMDRILRNIDTVAEQIISPRQEVSWGVDNEPEYQVGIRRPGWSSRQGFHLRGCCVRGPTTPISPCMLATEFVLDGGVR